MPAFLAAQFAEAIGAYALRPALGETSGRSSSSTIVDTFAQTVVDVAVSPDRSRYALVSASVGWIGASLYALYRLISVASGSAELPLSGLRRGLLSV